MILEESATTVTQRPPLSFTLIAAFGSIKLLLHLTVIFLTPYEIHRDEFLYLAMGQHLRFWSMDFPPWIAVLANTARLLFGDTLFAIRIFPALAGAAIVVLTGMIARELGGTRAAQGLSMLAVVASPLFMRSAALFQPVVWDQLWWTLGLYAISRLVTNQVPACWLLLGTAGGMGLLTKFSILFFGMAAFVAFLLSERRIIFSRGSAMALAAALCLGSPSIVGQIQLGFPVAQHMDDLATQQLHRVTYGDFMFGQLWMLGPSALLAILGLISLFASASMRRFQVIGWTCVTAFLILLLLHGKPYYVGPIYPALFAAGAVAFSRLSVAYRGFLTTAAATVLLVTGIAASPFGLPILPPQLMARFAAKIGLTAAVTTNRGTVLPLPQDFADMLGWQSQVRAVANAFSSLSEHEKATTWLVAGNYGEAGALEYYGPRCNLPSRIMLPNNYLLWPPNPCESVLTIGISQSDLERFFGSVTVLEHFDHPWMVEEERQLRICFAKDPLRDIREAWKRKGPRYR